MESNDVLNLGVDAVVAAYATTSVEVPSALTIVTVTMPTP
jgi:hypothetical protein